MLIDEDKSPDDYEEIIDALTEQLAAAWATIERARAANEAPHENTKQSNSRMTAVSMALGMPSTDALQAVKEAAWDEGAASMRDIYGDPGEENPYRKDTTDE